MVLINNKLSVILTLLRGASDKFMFKQLLLVYYSKISRRSIKDVLITTFH